VLVHSALVHESEPCKVGLHSGGKRC
jgi:hypothetical protein